VKGDCNTPQKKSVRNLPGFAVMHAESSIMFSYSYYQPPKTILLLWYFAQAVEDSIAEYSKYLSLVL